jgi:hypothetical protein
MWEESVEGEEEEEVMMGEESTSYTINTPQMHANLHSEFIHSVSILLVSIV